MITRIVIRLAFAGTALAAAEAHHFTHWPLLACGTKGECRAAIGTPELPAMLHATDYEAQFPERGGRADPGMQVSGTTTIPT